MKKTSIIAIALLLVFIDLCAQSFRYVESIFQDITIISDVIFTTVPSLNSPFYNENSTSNQDFKMDIYVPDGDNLTSRPAIVFAHGGGFVTGNKEVDDIVAFCEGFAKKGYVTVAIDYRQGVEVADNADLHYTRAAWRGLQDGRSAIRFLRANTEAYGITPDMIYWGGNSAGSFIGLNTLYLNNNEKPNSTGSVNYSVGIIPFSGPDLGPIDIGDNLEFNGKPNAVMACWGGVNSLQIIQKENSTPIFLIHGTNDIIVPFNSGSPFNLSNVSPIFGSNQIHQRLLELGIEDHRTYFVEGEGHEFYGVWNGNWINGIGGNEYWDIILGKATHFFYEQHKPQATFDLIADGLYIQFFDQCEGAISWLWDFGDGIISDVQSPTHTYDFNGDYKVELYIENDIHSWDTVSKIISVTSSTSVNNVIFSRISLYPTPAKEELNLDLGILLDKFEVRIFNLQGKLICRQMGYHTNHIRVNTQKLPMGSYFVQLQHHDQIFRHKFLIF